LQSGSCQQVAAVPEEVQDIFVVSQDITAEQHVRMQASLQAFVDNSLSKTCNFPADATETDVAEAYNLGWTLGCKGLTVYVTGSRKKVVLETKDTAADKEASAAELKQLFHESKKPRPTRLRGSTYLVDTPMGKSYVTVNENGGRDPFEVFISTAKAGSETSAISEAIGRLISYVLRISSPILPRERLEEAVRQLEGIGGGRSLGFGPNRVRSLPDGVARALRGYLNDKAENDPSEALHSDEGQLSFRFGALCPDCGEAAVVNEEGCRKCYACGFSEC
jgi:ribonucleoside-diphosphate reductase alpha chain